MTDSFVFELIEKFNGSSVVAFDLTRGDNTISMKKAEGCTAAAPAQSFSAPSFAQPLAAPYSAAGYTAPGAIQPSASGDSASAPSSAGASSSAAAQSASAQTSSAPASKAAAVAELTAIKSPIVGTFYRAPSPDSPSYAEPGKKMKKGDPLCILEAMKMMNTLECEFDCEIVEVLIQNGDLAEYDQPLFSVRKL